MRAIDRDEAERLRVRDGALADGLSLAPDLNDPGTPCLVARTTTIATYPTAAQRFYACSPVAVLGPEVEGGAAALSPLASTFFALNLGGTVPPPGTDLVVAFVGNRWVFRHDA